MRILNLYAGIGGNRELWTDCEVTAVEFDEAIAAVYYTRYPQDAIVIGDAVSYLEDHYKEFDAVWASPPCQSHGQYRHNVGVLAKGYAPLVPDMTRLYGTIQFLSTYFNGVWVVENTKPYYAPLIEPTFILQRHLFWSNFSVPHMDVEKAAIRTKNKIGDFDGAEFVQGSNIKNKRQVLRNCVDKHVGLHIFNHMKEKHNVL